MNKKAIFEKKIQDFIRGSVKDFAKSKAIAGSVAGGGIGGLAGVADTFMKQNEGAFEDMGASELAKLYLQKGLLGAGTGAGAGALIGGMRGKNISNKLIKDRLKDAKKLIAGKAPHEVENILHSMSIGNKFQDIHAMDYLKNSDSFLDRGAAGILDSIGISTPAQKSINPDEITKGISRYLDTKGGAGAEEALAMLEQAGLAKNEIEALKYKARDVIGDYSTAAPNLRQDFEDNVSSFLQSRGASKPSSYNFPAPPPPPAPPAPVPPSLAQLKRDIPLEVRKAYADVGRDPLNAVFAEQLTQALKKEKLLNTIKAAYKDIRTERSRPGGPVPTALKAAIKNLNKALDKLRNISQVA